MPIYLHPVVEEPDLDRRGYPRSPVTRSSYRKGKPNPWKGRTHPAEPPTPEEVWCVIHACKRTLTGRRDAALIMVYWRAGLRCAEGLALFPKDLDLERGVITVLCGKNSKPADQSGPDNLTSGASMQTTELTGVVAEHIDAVNSLDTDAIVATFADDAYVNDSRREFVGRDAIRRWAAKELVGDSISIDVREVLDHHGDTIVRGAYDGTFDRTNLPDELVLSNYFSVRDNQIVSLVIIFNRPADY